MARFNLLKATLLSLAITALLLVAKNWNESRAQLQKSRKLVQLKGGGTARVGKRRVTADRENLLHQTPRNTEKSQSKLHDDQRGKPLVLYTLFAGRQSTLELQIPHVLDLLERSVIDEVHLWDLTCKQHIEHKGWFGNGSEDTKFLWEKLWPMDKRIYIASPPECSWKKYYEYYAPLLRVDDVLMKVDDDIIFVDTSRVQGFVNTIRKHRQVYVWSASVINNGVVAGLHSKDGILPDNVVDLEHETQRPLTEGCLYNNSTAGMIVHRNFLADPQKYYQPPPNKELRLINGRVSINFVAWLGQNFKQTMSYIKSVSTNIDAGGGDEYVITELGSKYFGQKIVVYLPLVVAHASFGSQNIYERIIPMYKRATHLRNSGEWIPPAGGFEFPYSVNV